MGWSRHSRRSRVPNQGYSLCGGKRPKDDLVFGFDGRIKSLKNWLIQRGTGVSVDEKDQVSHEDWDQGWCTRQFLLYYIPRERYGSRDLVLEVRCLGPREGKVSSGV